VQGLDRAEQKTVKRSLTTVVCNFSLVARVARVMQKSYSIIADFSKAESKLGDITEETFFLKKQICVPEAKMILN